VPKNREIQAFSRLLGRFRQVFFVSKRAALAPMNVAAPVSGLTA
jgi:hypothetical protein